MQAGGKGLWSLSLPSLFCNIYQKQRKGRFKRDGSFRPGIAIVLPEAWEWEGKGRTGGGKEGRETADMEKLAPSGSFVVHWAYQVETQATHDVQDRNLLIASRKKQDKKTEPRSTFDLGLAGGE